MMMGGDSAALCEKLCIGGTCTLNVCTWPATLLIATGKTLASVGELPAGSAQYDVLAAEGTCFLAKLTADPWVIHTPFDAGTMTIETETAGVHTFPPPDESNLSLVDLAPNPLFTDGDTLTFAATGGADYPAFSLSIPAPPAITVFAGAVVAGTPFEITWASAAPPSYVAMIGINGASLFCFPSAPDSLTISGEMTSLFGPDPESFSIGAFKISEAQEDFGGAGLNAILRALSVSVKSVSYTP